MSHPAYRPDIDGLRAVAVLSVVTFHAFPDALPGGFVGVDVFFVISGYLISSIILSGIGDGSFRYTTFYARRIRRIFPALALVLAACLSAGYLVMTSEEYASLGKGVAAGAGFVANLLLMKDAPYFAPASEANSLLHLWSLGVEEQFYIVQPLLLTLAARLRMSLLATAISVFVASFALNIALRASASIDFYAPYTRFWELMAGTLLAYWSLYGRSSPKYMVAARAGCEVAGVVGLALIAYAAVTLGQNRAYPGWWALLPVCGAVLVIAAGGSSLTNRIVLASRPMVAVGLVSYPLYLWHWPMLSFLRLYHGGHAPVGQRLAALALAALLSWATFRLVERPLRFGRNLPEKAWGLVALLTALGAAGLWVYGRDGLPDRPVARATIEIAKAKADWSYRETTLRDGRIEGITVLHGGSPRSAIFIGDSLMGQYFPRIAGLYEGAPPPRLTTLYASRNHCRPEPFQPDISGPDRAPCAKYYDAAMALAAGPDIETVVLGGRWMFGPDRPDLQASEDRLTANIRGLVNAGKRVVLLSWPPHDHSFDPDVVAKPYRAMALFGSPRPAPDASRARADIEAADRAANTRLSEIAARSGATYVNVYDTLCPAGRCVYLRDGKPTYVDGLHLRATTIRADGAFLDALVGAD